MADIYSHLASGSTWQPTHREINGFRDAARAHRDQARGGGPPPPAGALAASARALVKNTTGGHLAAGSVVALGDSLLDPATQPSAAFQGPIFEAAVPAIDTQHFAILLEPIANDAIGRVAIPNAAWARVDVGDEGHTAATAVATSTTLVSGSSGRFPIVWKSAGTGELWALIALATAGSTIRWAEVTATISARTLSGTDWVAGSGTVQPKKPGGAGMIDDGPTIVLTNWLPIPFAVGATIEYDPDTLEVREGTCPLVTEE